MQFYKTTTDDTLREDVQHGSPDFPFCYYVDDIWQYDFHYIDWHWHHELEFVTVSKGTVVCLIGTEEILLPEGCGIFINSGVMHRFETNDGAIMPNIVFLPELLAPESSLIYKKYVYPFIRSNIDFQIFDPKTPWQNRLLHILYSIYKNQDSQNTSEFQILQLLFQLWELMINHIETGTISEKSTIQNIRQAKLQSMIQFIRDHYKEEITLSDIAASAAISKSSALQIFKAGIHCSPIGYLIHYRLTQASILLRKTEKPVTAIALENGFVNSGYFCRKFKEFYKMTPNEYRRYKSLT